jgi:WD40 repeat protein
MKTVIWCLSLIFCSPLFSQEAKLVLPVGHTSPVTSVAYSPNGKYLVTASWDNTAKIWQASDGRLLSDLKGHTESLVSASFSPDGKYIVTASKDSTARLWLAANGRLLRELKGHKHWLNNATFSPNGKYVITASQDHTAIIWLVATGLPVVELRHTNEVATAQFSLDGNYVVTASWDSTAKIWLAATGRLHKTLRGHTDFINTATYSPDGKAIVTASNDRTAKIWNAETGTMIAELEGHSNYVNGAQFSPDGAYIVTAAMDHTAAIWQALDGKLLHRLQGHADAVISARFGPDGTTIATTSKDGTAKIWRTSDGRLLATLKGHTDAVSSIAFSPDNKYLSTSSWDETAKIWNAPDGRLRSDLRGHTSVITAADFSPDGAFIVAASWDKTAKIWNALDGRLRYNLKGHADWVNSAVFSPDGKYVVTASNDSTARLWDVSNGAFIRELKGHNDWVSMAQFSADGAYIVTASSDNTAKVWRVSDGTLVSNLKGHTEKVRTAQFSPDGKYVATASWDDAAIIWLAATGQLLHRLRGHTDDVRTAVFSPDSKYVVTASWDSTAKVWSVLTGMLLSNLKGHTNALNTALFNPDGKQILTTALDGTARTWEGGTGRHISELKGHRHSVNAGQYSPDGQTILTESWDGTAKLWNAATGALLQDLKGHEGSLKSATFSPDGAQVVTTSEDNTLKKWNASTGNLLYTFFSVDSTDYLIINNQGQYDGTEAARKMLYYVCDNEIVDLEQFKDLTWEPNLAGKMMGLNKEPITAKGLSQINICNYTPAVEEKAFRNGSYHFEITPKRGGIGSVELYVNGKLIKTFLPSALVKKGPALLLQVRQQTVAGYFSTAGENEVQVKATTHDGSIISRGATLAGVNEKKGAVQPHIYILSIGVSQYKGAQLKLNYASKDAIDFSQALTASAQKLFNSTGRQNVHTYTFNTEMGSSRWPAKAAIEKLIDSIAVRAKADDILILFFAGHGVLQAGAKRFYLLTAEASQFELAGVEKEVAISTDELREWLRKIKAAKQVLILDACNSGEVVQNLQDVMVAREVPADQQRALESLKDKTGLFILAASASGHSAYETTIYGQGLLTYSLLSGIKMGGGLKDSKFIDVTRWFNFASDHVNVLARDIGGRQHPQVLGNASFVVGMVDKEVLDGINLAVKKKIMRRSLFIQDAELLSDDLNFTGLVNGELNNLSERGKESPLIYAPDNTALDDFSIRGKYTVVANEIILKVSVYQGQRERVDEFELKGAVNKREELAGVIVEKVQRFLKQL